MSKRHSYPRLQLLRLPPDPRRTSVNMAILVQRSPRALMEVVCCNGCGEKGRAESDGSCRHTTLVIDQLKPWWKSRTRPVQASTPAPASAAAEGGAS